MCPISTPKMGTNAICFPEVLSGWTVLLVRRAEAFESQVRWLGSHPWLSLPCC